MLIQLLLVLGFIFALWLTWKRFRQQVITLFEAIAWSLLWVGGVIVSVIPKLTEYLATFFGVGRGVDLILYAAVAVQFFLIFKLFVSHEKMERLLTKLVQKQSLRDLNPMDPRASSDSPEDDKRV